MIIPYDKRITEKFPELYDNIQNSYVFNLVLYITNSNYRKAVNIREWLKGLDCEIPDDLKIKITLASYDAKAIEVLRWVNKNIKYTPDTTQWKMSEYWQTPTETLNLRTGDCEDGAILIYVLCRKLGIPSNRLLLFAGDVKGGGHAWLGYKPEEYPLNYAFLDWCYWANTNSIGLRHLFYIKEDSTVWESGTSVSNYYKVWFGVNEDVSIKKFKYNAINRRDNK